MGIRDLFKNLSRPDIARLRKERDIKGLVDALDCPKETPIRMGAAAALGEVWDTNAIDALILLLDDKNTRLRNQASKSLAKIGKPAIEPLIRRFTSITHNKTAPLPDGSLHERLIELLGEIGDKRAAEVLCEYLFQIHDSVFRGIDDSRSLRMMASAIRKIGDPAALNHLIKKLCSFDDQHRRRAIEILSRMGQLAFEPLILSLRGKDPAGQGGAAEALGNIGDVRAVEPLIQALKSARPTASDWCKIWIAKGAIITALGKIGDKRAIGPLIEILLETHINAYRFLVEDALADIGESVVEPLIGLLDRESIAYWQKDYEHYRELLKSGTACWCSPAANTLIKVGQPAVPLLLKALEDKRRVVRMAAAHALHRIADTSAKNVLAAVLTHESDEFREYVVSGMRVIRQNHDGI